MCLMDSKLSNNEQLPEWLADKRDELAEVLSASGRFKNSPRSHILRPSFRDGWDACYAEMQGANEDNNAAVMANVKCILDQHLEMQEREKKLVEALKFYSRKWDTEKDWIVDDCVMNDWGDKARTTLKELGIHDVAK